MNGQEVLRWMERHQPKPCGADWGWHEFAILLALMCAVGLFKALTRRKW